MERAKEDSEWASSIQQLSMEARDICRQFHRLMLLWVRVHGVPLHFTPGFMLTPAPQARLCAEILGGQDGACAGS